MTEKEVKPETAVEAKKGKINSWMMISIVLLIALIGIVLYFGSGATGFAVANTNTLKPEEAAVKSIKFINENLVQPGTEASFVSSKESNGVYNITIFYQGRNISVFTTTDGSYMFLSAPLDLSQTLPKAEQAPEEQPTETQKTDKPTVELYVMSFCPYGIQAEAAMKPVVDLLGSKADIKVRFIANVGGTTPDSIQSLHGAVEAQEDLRQACVMKYYDQKTFWNYLMSINTDCSSKYRDTAAYDTCWKDAATKAGIDVSKIDTCSKGSDGVSLIKADDDLTSQYGVSGSPTLLINGVKYSGGRTPDAYKEAICNAFTTPPAECSQQLSTTGSEASGGCA